MDDQTLLAQYVATGDASAFAELTRRHLPLVRSVCTRVLGNSHDAEEVAQECFFELSRHAAEVHSSLPGWLHRAATSRSLNAIRSRIRRKRRERECGTCENAVTSEPVEPDLQRLIQGALKELPDDLRLPVVLHYVDGKTQRDVAVKLGVNQSTISRRMQDALRLLRDKLTQAGYAATAPAVVALIQNQTTTTAEAAVTEIAVAGVAGQICAGTSWLTWFKGGAAVLVPVLGYLLFNGWVSLVIAFSLAAYVMRFRPAWAAEVMASFGSPNLYQQPPFERVNSHDQRTSVQVTADIAKQISVALFYIGLSVLFAWGTAIPPWGTVILALSIATAYLVSASRQWRTHKTSLTRQIDLVAAANTAQQPGDCRSNPAFDASLNGFDTAQMLTIGLGGLFNTAVLISRADSGIVWPAAILCTLISAGMIVTGGQLAVRLLRREGIKSDNRPDFDPAACVSRGTLVVMAIGTAIVAALSAWIAWNPAQVRGDSITLVAIQTSMLGWIVYRIVAFHRLTSPQLVRRIVIATLICCFVLNSGLCLANWLPSASQ